MLRTRKASMLYISSVRFAR